MNNYKIAILLTTFLRDTLLYKTTQTIIDNYTKDCILLIADQGYRDANKDVHYDYLQSQIPCEVYYLPFDCGLSYARNFLVRIANEKKIPYSLITADSIEFLQPYNFDLIINFLESDKLIGIVGFELENSKCSWEYLMEITPKGIKFNPSTHHLIYQQIPFKKVDICRNIFLAKTNTIIDLWDEEQKLAEHELAFIEYKKRGYHVYWTDTSVFKRISSNTSQEYQVYRKRFNDYVKLVKQKLNISGWVIYPKERK